MPVRDDVIKQIDLINQIPDAVERALEYFAYACKQQLFWDGNKRTSTLAANKILIENGQGILTIGEKGAEEFNITLNNWYLKNDIAGLKNCLKKNKNVGIKLRVLDKIADRI